MKAPTVLPFRFVPNVKGWTKEFTYFQRDDGRLILRWRDSLLGKSIQRTVHGWKEAEALATTEAEKMIARGNQSVKMLSGRELLEYNECLRLMKGKSILDACRYWVEHCRENLDSVPAVQVFDEYLDHQIMITKVKDQTRAGIKRVKSKFLDVIGGDLPVHIVLTPEIIQEVLSNYARGGASTTSVSNLRLVISGFCSYAHNNKYIKTNPFGDVRLSKGRFGKKEYVEPVVWTRDEFVRLLKFAKPKHRLLLVVAAYTGLRVFELFRVRLDDFMFDTEELVVRSVVNQKTRRRRIVPLCGAVKEWFEYTGMMGKTGRLLQSRSKDEPYVSSIIRQQSKRAGLEHKDNAYRHSFISACVARGDAKQLIANWCGNSVSTIDDHYLNVISRQDGIDWFTVSPAEVEYGNYSEKDVQKVCD